jgi:hypothetical protein
MNANEVHFLHTYSLCSRLKVFRVCFMKKSIWTLLMCLIIMDYLYNVKLLHVLYTVLVTGQYSLEGGTRWCSRMRNCSTSQKFAGSIPDGVTWIFHQHNPSGHTMTLGLTQPLTEMSTRNISWGVKVAGGWQPYHLHVPIVLKSGSLNLLEPSGPVQASRRIALTLPFTIFKVSWPFSA